MVSEDNKLTIIVSTNTRFCGLFICKSKKKKKTEVAGGIYTHTEMGKENPENYRGWEPGFDVPGGRNWSESRQRVVCTIS